MQEEVLTCVSTQTRHTRRECAAGLMNGGEREREMQWGREECGEVKERGSRRME
jgi:hypothetical protein